MFSDIYIYIYKDKQVLRTHTCVLRKRLPISQRIQFRALRLAKQCKLFRPKSQRSVGHLAPFSIGNIILEAMQSVTTKDSVHILFGPLSLEHLMATFIFTRCLQIWRIRFQSVYCFTEI